MIKSIRGVVKFKYQNIYELYNIKEIANDYVLVKRKKNLEKLYIFEVRPMTILDNSLYIKEEIIDLYLQFLQEIKSNFQICISNKKMDVEKYIEKYYPLESIAENNDIYNLYKERLKEELQKEEIYESKMYIVVSIDLKSNDCIDEVKNTISKLNKIGCKTKQIENVNNLKELLYGFLNKE